MDSLTLLSFLSVAFLLTLMPGPDILFVIAQSIAQGKRAGVITAFGLCTGLIIHLTAAILGVTALIYQSALAFSIVKYIGAVYLLFLAWQAFRDKGGRFLIASQARQKRMVLYRKGILMNVLNPKVSLFFFALFPQFVSESLGNVPQQMILLGIVFIVQALVVFSGVSFFSEKIRNFLMGRPAVARKINLIQGTLFALISLQIAFSEK